MLLEYKYIKHDAEVRSLEYWSKPNNNNLSSTLINLYRKKKKRKKKQAQWVLIPQREKKCQTL